MKSILALALLTALPVQVAEAATVESDIGVSYTGIPIGRLTSTLTTDGKTYAYSGKAKTSGLVRIVTQTTASFDSDGTISGDAVVPRQHTTRYTRSSKDGGVAMSFAGGRVAKTSSVPAVKYKDGTVPVTKSHLANVVDPLTALVIPVNAGDVGNGEAICNRTVAVFDGKTRYNLKLSFAGQETGSAKGFSGPVYKCALRYQAVSGHRPWKDDVKFWNANRDASITLAQIGDQPVYGLFAFDLKLQTGRASGRARLFATR